MIITIHLAVERLPVFMEKGDKEPFDFVMNICRNARFNLKKTKPTFHSLD
ncbi:MAG: hypothetical protein IJA27_07720 [Lachnospiraceae bacterium]|nr:hypothetical protein [Lachnospiraceae bacterium]